MNILLGVTGSISAYKALDLISSSVKRGDVVKVIMTESAKMFVTEMSLAVMSKNPVGKHGYHNVFVAPAMNNNMWVMMNLWG